uniref:Uncharacterized protein n=1 Tax=Nelumbo nucifera TaxID=4432 RepID=A0A822Y7A0_NELNU|nr:TPA_asm: hypothetical protein HUJ06_026962 [Nelumbo nucifera]
MDTLRLIPMDGTYDQCKPLARLLAAIDTFPSLLLGKMLIGVFGSALAAAWVGSGLVANMFRAKAHRREGYCLVAFGTGQPLGFYGSWTLFTLAHHNTVWLSTELMDPSLLYCLCYLGLRYFFRRCGGGSYVPEGGGHFRRFRFQKFGLKAGNKEQPSALSLSNERTLGAPFASSRKWSEGTLRREAQAERLHLSSLMLRLDEKMTKDPLMVNLKTKSTDTPPQRSH